MLAIDATAVRHCAAGLARALNTTNPYGLHTPPTSNVSVQASESRLQKLLASKLVAPGDEVRGCDGQRSCLFVPVKD